MWIELGKNGEPLITWILHEHVLLNNFKIKNTGSLLNISFAIIITAFLNNLDRYILWLDTKFIFLLNVLCCMLNKNDHFNFSNFFSLFLVLLFFPLAWCFDVVTIFLHVDIPSLDEVDGYDGQTVKLIGMPKPSFSFSCHTFYSIWASFNQTSSANLHDLDLCCVS